MAGVYRSNETIASPNGSPLWEVANWLNNDAKAHCALGSSDE